MASLRRNNQRTTSARTHPPGPNCLTATGCSFQPLLTGGAGTAAVVVVRQGLWAEAGAVRRNTYSKAANFCWLEATSRSSTWAGPARKRVRPTADRERGEGRPGDGRQKKHFISTGSGTTRQLGASQRRRRRRRRRPAAAEGSAEAAVALLQIAQRSSILAKAVARRCH